MASWDEYKKHVKKDAPELYQDINEAEAISKIVGAMIEKRHDPNLSQRDLSDNENGSCD